MKIIVFSLLHEDKKRICQALCREGNTIFICSVVEIEQIREVCQAGGWGRRCAPLCLVCVPLGPSYWPDHL